MKVQFPLVLLICGSILNGIVADTCNTEEQNIGHWYGQVSQFVKMNQNVTQYIIDLHAKIQQLEHNLEQIHKITHKQLEECLKNCQSEIDGKIVLEKLADLEGHIKEVQENTRNGDIVIQRRIDGSVDFYRNWADYKVGFGNSSGEFFIGLEKLHQLTNTRPYELLIVMEDWENDRRYAKYDQFIVGSEVERYLLKSLGTYSGSAGDAMTSVHLGKKFSTKDQDNDTYEKNCAVEFTGAWWYGQCHHR